MNEVSRRSFLGGSLASAVTPGFFSPARAEASETEDASLASLAASKGLFFGMATQASHLENDPGFATLVAKECACLVSEWDMKWKPLQPELSRFAPEGMDTFMAYAALLGLWVRGHALFWHQSLPYWFDAEVKNANDWDRVIVPYANFVGTRYGANLRQWDVLNEGINPADGEKSQLRRWRMTELFGESFPKLAFELAHSVAPDALLFYNDYGLEYNNPWHKKRRTAVLRNLEKWKAAGVPIHGFGIQAHLTVHGENQLATRQLREFLLEIGAMGLEIVVSELDVSETRFDRPVAKRDSAVADETRRFLDVALDVEAVKGVMTWGLSDRYSWLKGTVNAHNRGLPYDTGLSKKPMHAAIAECLKNTIVRNSTGAT